MRALIVQSISRTSVMERVRAGSPSFVKPNKKDKNEVVEWAMQDDAHCINSPEQIEDKAKHKSPCRLALGHSQAGIQLSWILGIKLPVLFSCNPSPRMHAGAPSSLVPNMAEPLDSDEHTTSRTP